MIAPNQGLAIKMFKDADPQGTNALPARDTFRPALAGANQETGTFVRFTQAGINPRLKLTAMLQRGMNCTKSIITARTSTGYEPLP